MESIAADLAQRLAACAEAVCHHYLPNGVRRGSQTPFFALPCPGRRSGECGFPFISLKLSGGQHGICSTQSCNIAALKVPPQQSAPHILPIGERPMTAMKTLKDAAWTTHLRLEKRLGVKRRFSDIARYREHIALFEAFHTVAETTWRPQIEPALSDFEARRKTPLLLTGSIGRRRIIGAPVPRFRCRLGFGRPLRARRGGARRTASATGGAGQARSFPPSTALRTSQATVPKSEPCGRYFAKLSKLNAEPPMRTRAPLPPPNQPFWRWKCGFAASDPDR